MDIQARQEGVGWNMERLARYRWAAQLLAGGRVLDAACGSGWGTALLARSAAEATGVDFAPPLLAEARRDHAGVARFEEGDLRDLPFGDGEFDHVVCFEAIAHVADPEQVLDELRRVLRPGGLLLISAPNADVYPAGNPLHLSEMTSTALEAMLRDRFATVAVHRQQSYHASLLGPADLLAQDDADAAVEVEVRKLVGGPSGSELHAVAVATDGELPPEPAHLVLGEDLDYDRQSSLLEEWQDRAVRAEAKALALTKELRALQG